MHHWVQGDHGGPAWTKRFNIYSFRHFLPVKKVTKCAPVERLESQRVCQKVPRRVCRQVNRVTKYSISGDVNVLVDKLPLITDHTMLTSAKQNWNLLQEPGKVCRQVGRQRPQTTSVRVCNWLLLWWVPAPSAACRRWTWNIPCS